MADVALILGAGFSKAVSERLPLLKELGELLLDRPIARDLNDSERDLLRENPEALLTMLSQDLPWKRPADHHADLARFLRLTEEISTAVQAREISAFSEPPPAWAIDLIRLVHKHRIPVVTLNYDTVVERLAFEPNIAIEHGGDVRIYCDTLYRLPMMFSLQRIESTIGVNHLPTFRLMKLHGSTNWFYSGPGAPPGDEVYFTRPQPDNEHHESWWNYRGWTIRDKVALLVPPVTEKTVHFKNGILRSVWRDARETLKSSRHLYCVGYSLPRSDLAMELFLRFCDLEGGVIHLVNRCDPAEALELEARYKRVFGLRSVDTQFVHSGSPAEEIVDHMRAQLE